jgi:hypothetical protein
MTKGSFENKKRKQFIKSFKRVRKDKNMKKLAEEGLSDYHDILDK